jgi:hypothetical protein
MVAHDPLNIGEMWENIPCWTDGVWSLKSFDSREAFAQELETNYFKEPGEYELDETIHEFRAQSKRFDKTGYYCDHLENSLDYEDYWDWETLKSRRGVFYFNGEKSWYLPRDYYFWINFTKIYDKVKKKAFFAEIQDSQIWMSLYNCIAELRFKHGVMLKKRQFGSSYYYAAKQLNILWFEEESISKMGASLDAYLTGVNGTWKYVNRYKNFLNKNTAWYREFAGSAGDWTQKTEVTDEQNRKVEYGLGSTIETTSFQQSDTAGVGGPTSIFFYEEAGIAPRMDKTLEYLLPAMEAGDITTGYFVAAGTVGDLDQCKPLENLMRKAKANNFYTIRNKWVNDKNTVMETGLFIPEQYSMRPYIDEFGNSLVKEATARLQEMYDEWEKDLDPEIAQLRKSQRPMNMEVAFAARTESRFPTALVKSHKLEVEDGKYPYELIALEKNNKGVIEAKGTNKPPISEFPIPKKQIDKTGSIVVWERPDQGEDGKPDWGTYYASVDPVSEGKTTSSDSLCSIFVYKNPIQVTKYVKGVPTTFIEGDKVVCSWTGRFDDINETHLRLQYIIEWYNAWTIVEANVSLFILHMVHHKLQKYLVPKSEMVFIKEHGFNKGTHQEYGWKNTGTMFVNNLLTYLIESLREVTDKDFDSEGNVISETFGIERIPDPMALEEMIQYEHGLNVDRLISLSALIAFVKIQQANRGLKKRIEADDKSKEYLDKSDEMYNLKGRSPFKHMGGNGNSNTMKKPSRRAFKNLK